jgi:hypothetical protein
VPTNKDYNYSLKGSNNMSVQEAAFFYNDFRDLLKEFNEAELSTNRLATSMQATNLETLDVATSN